MRLLTSLLLSVLAMTTTSVSADGLGQYNNKQAQQQATVDRQNTITVQANQGVFLTSRSLTYNPATNTSGASTAYDEVDISATSTQADLFGIFPGKVEIEIDNLNITTAGGRHGNVNIQEFAFAWRPFSVIQYVETSATQNGFDVNDTLCHEYQIRPTRQNPFTFKWLNSTVVQADTGNTTLQTFQGTSADGVFTIILKAIGATGTTTNTAQFGRAKSVWIDGRFVSPTSIKFDTIVDVTQAGFNLNKNGTCGTNYQIAIKSWARSMQDVFARTVTKQTINGTVVNKPSTTFLDRIQTGGDATPFGFFTWATTATVTKFNDDTTAAPATTNVIATSLIRVINKEDQDDLRVTKQAIHSFDAIRPGIIRWDPEFGADSTNPDGSGTTVNEATMTSISLMGMMIVAIMTLLVQ